MWLTNYIAKKNDKTAKTGAVSQSDVNTMSFNGSCQYRRVDFVAPFGISYCPPVGVTGVTVPTDSGNVVVGVNAVIDSSLEPGELLLFSSGGAKIHLKNNGKVYVNGKVIG